MDGEWLPAPSPLFLLEQAGVSSPASRGVEAAPRERPGKGRGCPELGQPNAAVVFPRLIQPVVSPPREEAGIPGGSRETK